MGHIWVFLESMSGSHGWVNECDASFSLKNSGFRGFLLTKFSERGAKFSSFSGVLVQTSFSKRGSHPLLHFSVLVVVGGCYYWIKKGGGKKNINKYFSTPLLREGKG